MRAPGFAAPRKARGRGRQAPPRRPRNEDGFWSCRPACKRRSGRGLAFPTPRYALFDLASLIPPSVPPQDDAAAVRRELSGEVFLVDEMVAQVRAELHQ